uniref:Gamma-aminobutyric acid type B receptor subunit 2 n=1 Tax=Romanomermis culicivorax TaxID=13658 RepID=A0A915KUE6_ROMCU
MAMTSPDLLCQVTLMTSKRHLRRQKIDDVNKMGDTANDLEQKLQENGMQLVTRVFVNDVADAVRNLKRSNARIIVGLFYEVVARQIMCQAFKAGLFGPRYVWFILGWFSENWFLPSENDERPVNCTRDEMAMAAENHFTTEALMFGQEGLATESGI